MSKIENPKKVLKKTLKVEMCDDNAHKNEKMMKKGVTIIFRKLLEIKYLANIMETLGDKKKCPTFYCYFCDYGTSKKSSYDNHLLSAKHQKRIIGDVKQTNYAKIMPVLQKYVCNNCSRTYQSRNGLWKHKKTCSTDNEPIIKDGIISDKELIIMLVKQNRQLMDVLKNGTNNTSHSHNNTNYSHNSHNKTFNLQFFLNETCKDAMNIGDFISSIKPQLADLEATGRLGYVEGVSNIILNNLKTLKIHDRPIHCSDQKREVIYIKNNDEWTKEEEDKPILTKAIKVIANENIKNIKEWRNEYPDCTSSNSKKNDLYLKIVSNAMSGSSVEESSKNINKIISNVAKQVVIDKTQ